MEPLNRRGGGIRQDLTGGQRGTLFLFLTNFKQKGLGYKTVLQTAEQEAGFFWEGKVGVAG